MKILYILSVVIILATQGCVDRIPLYSPRQTDTEAHREAIAPKDCLDCHDLTKRDSHSPAGDCRKCHKLINGN